MSRTVQACQLLLFFFRLPILLLVSGPFLVGFAFFTHGHLNVNQQFLPDVGEGNVDVGITGIDVVEESNVDVDTILVRYYS